jgi:hypothetical protein
LPTRSIATATSRAQRRVVEPHVWHVAGCDVSDIEHPKCRVVHARGACTTCGCEGHAVLGAHDAGFHVFDISGELRGDLRAQGREIASLNTADMNASKRTRRSIGRRRIQRRPGVCE